MHLRCVFPQFAHQVHPNADARLCCALCCARANTTTHNVLHYLSSGPPENKPTRILWLWDVVSMCMRCDREEWTYRRKLRYHNPQHRQKINGKIRKIIMRIMRAQQKQHNRHAQQKLLRRRILVPIVDLLPHVEVIVGASIELEWYATHPVEHQVGTKHVGDVGERP